MSDDLHPPAGQEQLDPYSEGSSDGYDPFAGAQGTPHHPPAGVVESTAHTASWPY